MALPVRVAGYSTDGATWTEIARSESLSRFGMSIRLQRTVSLGEVLHLSLALPKRLRQFDLTDTSYRVYSSVRDLGGRGDGGALVGVMFLGKFPPTGYDKGVRLFLPHDQVRFRRHPRYEVRVDVTLRRLEGTAQPREERTVTEVLGLGGALVPTALRFAQGDRVGLETQDGLLKTRCSVQTVTIGQDRVSRLSLMFLDDTAGGAAREVLRRNGIQEAEAPEEGRDATQAAPAPPSLRTRSVSFDRREAFPECTQNKHGACPGWGWEAATRALRLCRCACHGG